MQLHEITLEVRDRNLKRVGVVLPTDATFQFRDDFNGVGEWSLTVPLEHPMVVHLRQPGSGIIVTGPAGVLFTGPMTRVNSKASKDAPEGMVTFSGESDDCALGDALAWPVPGTYDIAAQMPSAANDPRSGDAESVMHAYVNANIGPGAVPERRKALLRMGSNLMRGPLVTKTARFPVLGQLCAEIATVGFLGFKVQQDASELVFSTYEMRDRSREIRMDLWNNTLASYDVSEIGAAVTHVIVGGREVGSDTEPTTRQFLLGSSPESEEQATAWGRRREQFLDRRAAADEAELTQALKEQLIDQGTGQSIVKFVPMDEFTMRYQLDWGLGDWVTAVIEGREIKAVVRAVVIVVDTSGVRIACALGDPSALDEASAAKAFMNRTEQRVSALERAAGWA